MKKYQQNCMINMLLETFKFICRYEYKMTIDEIKHELGGFEKLTFEQKLKFFSTYKFMKAPIKLQCAKYGITGGFEK